MQITEKQLINTIRQEETLLNQKRKLLNDLINVGRETHLAQESIKELMTNPKKILVDLGAGIYAEAEIKNPKKYVCQFGENIYKNENNTKIKTKLDKRTKNIEKQINTIQKETFKIENKINQLMSLMRQIEAEKRKNFSVK